MFSFLTPRPRLRSHSIPLSDVCCSGVATKSMSDSPPPEPQLAHRPDSSRLRTNMKLMLADATSFNVMVGIGETYFPAFALALNKGELISGLVATLPMLAGATLQMISPQAIAAFGSYRRWVATCATVQALSLVPMAYCSFQQGMSTLLLFLAASIYWAAGQATVPAWNTWVEALIPTKIRAPFFAFRTRLAQFGMLAGVIGGGLALQWGRGKGIAIDIGDLHFSLMSAAPNGVRGDGYELTVFGAMFVIAAAARFVSASCLATQSDARMLPHFRDHKPSNTTKRPRLLTSANKRLLSYVFMMQGAVYLSGPYFAAYMLKHLKLDYFEFVLLIASSYLARILVLRSLGIFAHKAGAHRLLWIGAVGITPLPAMWLVSNDFVFLLVLQIVGGFVWAAHELAMALLFIDSIPRHARVSVLAIYNFGNSAAMATGTIIGAITLYQFGEVPPTYLSIFAASSVLRIVALCLLRRVPPGKGATEHNQSLDIVCPPDVPLLERTMPEAEPIKIGETAAHNPRPARPHFVQSLSGMGELQPSPE